MTKSEFQSRIDKLQRIINKFDSRPRTGRNLRLLGLTLDLARLQWEMFAYATEDIEENEVGAMRKRTRAQIKESKAIYRKHAARYKAADYPVHRAKRMMAYTALITKAIAVSFKR